MSPTLRAALIGALIGAAIGIQGGLEVAILSAVAGGLLVALAHRVMTAKSLISQAALFGALFGAAFKIRDFAAAPSYFEFGGLIGAAAIGALLVAVAHRVMMGKQKPKV